MDCKYLEEYKEILNIDDKILKYSWEDFNICITDKKIIMFGAGSGADRILDNYNYSVSYIVDNNIKKQGKKYRGIDIESPDKIMNEDLDNTVILISSVFVKSIVKQLQEYGCKYIFSRKLMNYEERKIKPEDMVYVYEVRDILADKKSESVFMEIVERRNKKQLDCSDLIENEKTQYFDNDIVSNCKDEVFIDGGAFIGDTIEDFEKWANTGYKKIYAYEADLDNYKILQKISQNNKKIRCINKALWNKKEKLKFTSDKSRSLLTDDGIVVVEAEPLHVETGDKVTFIKLDIEGAELEALEGMKDIILENRPKLAICIYHKYDDLWKIPQYIHQLVPEYRLYVRHYHYTWEETVLYAVI